MKNNKIETRNQLSLFTDKMDIEDLLVRLRLIDTSNDETAICKQKEIIKTENYIQRELLAKKKLFVEEVAGFNDYLQELREDLTDISGKIYELKELRRSREIERCQNSMFVCCCLTMYILCVLLVLFVGGILGFC